MAELCSLSAIVGNQPSRSSVMLKCHVGTQYVTTGPNFSLVRGESLGTRLGPNMVEQFSHCSSSWLRVIAHNHKDRRSNDSIQISGDTLSHNTDKEAKGNALSHNTDKEAKGNALSHKHR